MEIIKVGINNLEHAKEAAQLFFDNKNEEETNFDFFKKKENLLYVAVIDKKVIGAIHGYILDRYDTKQKQLFLYSIDVLKEFREKGIGKKLVKAFLDNKSNEFKNCFVLTNRKNYAAINLYKSVGARVEISAEGDDILLKWE